ncbi:hypothetical protein [Thermus neutrinimicus]|uniref:hypothetical protein n=1 Tax=Thermus neutrinimicus TaxID=2908149 RepID=UPI001FAA4AE9|nr:hypothetical protein [Thermus neutrinimicus]
MRRRTFLVKLLPLLAVALLPSAWGEEGKEGGKRKSEEGKKRRDEAKEDNRSTPRYYGQVEGVEEDTLWVGGRALQVRTPLLPYLAPGMVVEVGPEGLAVLSPATWSYYQGPGSLVGLGQGPVRAWWGEGGLLWRVLPGYGGQASLVARYRRGTWQAVPKGFSLPRPPQEGWWLLALEGKTGKLIRRLE